MHRIPGVVAFGVGGFLATVILRQPAADRLFGESFGGSQVHVLYDSDVAIAAGGVVVAIVVAAFLGSRAALIVAVAAGVAVIGVLAMLGGADLAVRYAMSIAAGVVLGGLAGLSSPYRGPSGRAQWSQVALVSGGIVGVLLAPSLREVRFDSDTPRRYADFLPDSGGSLTGPTDLFIVIVAVVTVVALLAFAVDGGLRPDADSARRPVSTIAVIGGCLMSVAAVVVYWWLQESVFGGAGVGLRTWPFGYLLLAAALVLALGVPGRSGLLWVAITAAVASNAAGSSLVDASTPIVVIVVVLALVGVAVGWRVAQPLWGVAAQVVCTLLALTGESLVVAVAVQFVIPLAAAFTVVASLPSSETVTASALAVPAVLVATVGVQYGWTAYTPLTDAPDGLDLFTVSGQTTLILSTVCLVACGAAAAVIGRRPPTPVTGAVR